MLLADEPTGNLDSVSGQEVMDLLKELNRERGLTVLLVSHDPEVSAQARRVITLHDGLIVQRGLKVGDIDPRHDPRYATLVSEKSLAIGGGVLEALLTRPEIRGCLWN